MKNDNTIEHKLTIIAMSLRLILDVAGRDIMKTNDDRAYKNFLIKAKKEMTLSQEDQNFWNLTNSRLSKYENLEGIFAKYAHGSIPSDKGNILKHSKIVGDILSFYFNKNNE